MRCVAVPLALGVILTGAWTANGQNAELRSPLPYIAAPSGGASPIVEQPPARLRTGPPRIACWACPSNTPRYCGYYVGGGSVGCFGQPRMAAEGTWGWDYHGCWLPQRVALGWSHGRRYQTGAGFYRIEGPHLLKLLEHRGEEAGPP